LAIYTGTYECKADAKARFTLPSALKKQLDPVSADGFVLKRAIHNPCLELYAMSTWNEIMAGVNKLNRFVKKNNDFIRAFTAGVKILELDGSGRLLIPKDLQAFAGIDRELTLSASGDRVEIWNRTKYEEDLARTQAVFADLAEEVMGNHGSDEIS